MLKQYCIIVFCFVLEGGLARLCDINLFFVSGSIFHPSCAVKISSVTNVCLTSKKRNKASHQQKEVGQNDFHESDQKKQKLRPGGLESQNVGQKKYIGLKLRCQQGATRAPVVSQEALSCFKFILKAWPQRTGCKLQRSTVKLLGEVEKV